jgi:hypothetical protein
MVTVKWSKLTAISANFHNCNHKKSGIVNMINDHDQIWIDHFDHENFGDGHG